MEDANITAEQRANLAKLAAYLRTLPVGYPHFAMRRFTQDGRGDGSDAAHTPECGIAACAAGHGPLAGIPPVAGETWAEYSYRAFVYEGAEWDWFFGADWTNTDNTAHGAAERIEWFLANDLPDDAEDQRWGHAPLCYATEPVQ